MKNQDPTLLERYPAATVAEQLHTYINDKRQRRIEQVITHRLSSIHLAIEAPSDINNALAAIRSSEALGISDIHIIQAENDAAAVRPVTQGAIYWVDVHYYQTQQAFLNYIQQHNILLAGAIMKASTTISEVPIEKTLCLILGNEQRGLSATMQQACNVCYRIPMYGMSESLNLSVSAAISLYDTCSRKRQLLQNTSDLSLAQQQTLRARFYLNSVNPRLPQILFP